MQGKAQRREEGKENDELSGCAMRLFGEWYGQKKNLKPLILFAKLCVLCAFAVNSCFSRINRETAAHRGKSPGAPQAIQAALALFPLQLSRLTPLSSALIDAVTMFASIPTP